VGPLVGGFGWGGGGGGGGGSDFKCIVTADLVEVPVACTHFGAERQEA